MTAVVDIGGVKFGSGAPCVLISEVGTTALGNLERALALVDASAASGADAVKFQLINPDQISEPATTTYRMQVDGRLQDVNMAEMFKRLQFDAGQWKTIADRARQKNIMFFATADYEAGVDILDDLSVAMHKLSAWDMTFFPLIERMGRSGKPMMVDLGPATVEEIDDLEKWYYAAGGKGPIIYLHDYHTSNPAEKNMRTLEWLAARGKGPFGFSSPNRDSDVDFLAIALGAQVIEKRLTLAAADSAFHAHESLDPEEFTAWVKRIRAAEVSLGSQALAPSSKDLADKVLYYRSVCTLCDVAKGERLSVDNLGAKRPGRGIITSRLPEFWGRRAARDLPINTLLSDADISSE